MESELRALLKSRAQEMDLSRTAPDGMVRRIGMRRSALVGVGTAFLIALGATLWGGMPRLTQAEDVAPAQHEVSGTILEQAVFLPIRTGWFTIPMFDPNITLHLKGTWNVNVLQDGYFNLHYNEREKDNDSALSIVSYSHVFDPTVSLAKRSSLVEAPNDMVAYLRNHPNLRVDAVTRRTIGGVPAVEVKVTGLSAQKGIGKLENKLGTARACDPNSAFACPRGAAIVYNSFISPTTPAGATERLIFFEAGGDRFVIENLPPQPRARVEAVLDSIRFDS